jgi:hypothetical protein
MPFHNPIPDRENQGKTSAGLEGLVQAEKLMQIAILLPSAACIGWALGAWAGKALHQSWMSIAGIVLGGISGLVYVVRLVLATESETRKGNGSGRL